MAKTLAAYEIVNMDDPTIVETVQLQHGDPTGQVFDGLVRKVDFDSWFMRNRYTDGSTDE